MNQISDCTDEAIVNGILSDDRKALNTAIRCLYDRHTALLKDYVRRNSGSSQDADDVIQVVILNFIKAVRSEQYRPLQGVGVGAFLNTICKRHWLNALSQRERVTLRETEYYETDDQASEGVDELLEQREEMEHYLRQFDRLGERCKQILTAQRRDGLSMKEIADLMGFENERVAINEKFKCIQKLKNLLKP
ncbi:MAG: sigma-70 family RNA polymerase sigma factor [Cytophagaceae bacterium]|nr:sigma-70 family RNA polymerase sigma factor [Cytophagaceae bacterium]